MALSELAVICLAALGAERLTGASRGRRCAVGTLMCVAILERGWCRMERMPVYAQPPPVARLSTLLTQLQEEVVPFAALDEGPVPRRILINGHVFRFGNLPMVYGLDHAVGGRPTLLSPRHSLLVPPLPPGMFGVLGAAVVYRAAPCFLRQPDGFLLRQGRLGGCLLLATSEPSRFTLLSVARSAASDAEMAGHLQTEPGGPISVLASPSEVARRTQPSTHPERVTVQSYHPGQATLQVEAMHDRFLLARESWNPGWEARVDDVAVPTARAAGVFFVIPVPAGRHKVTLTYRQPGLAAGFCGSALWLACAGVALVRERSRRHTAAPRE